MAKKVDVKAVEKKKVSEFVSSALAKAGYTVADGTDYGMTANTLVLKKGTNSLENDVQIKFISPKHGETEYLEEVAE